MAAGRAAVLLAVAIALGVVLLNAADDVPGRRLSAGRSRSTATSVVTTTTLPRATTTTAALRQPKDVKVISANGTTVQGAAGKVRDMLRAAGYNVLAPGDTKKADASAVYYAPTFDREAAAVAVALALPPTAVRALPEPPPVTDLRGANIVVVVGPELAQRVVTSGGTGRSSTSTSTARARTTTTARATATTTRATTTSTTTSTTAAT